MILVVLERVAREESPGYPLFRHLLEAILLKRVQERGLVHSVLLSSERSCFYTKIAELCVCFVVSFGAE